MIWYDMIWYDMIWYDMIWYSMVYMVWYGMVWYDMIWYDMIWYDMIWYDMIWYDVIFQFSIFVLLATKCKSYEPPSNGLVACKYTNIWGGDTCTPQCNAKFEFSRAPAIMYICQASGQWLAFDYRPQVLPIMPWPDCSGELMNDIKWKWRNLKERVD